MAEKRLFQPHLVQASPGVRKLAAAAGDGAVVAAELGGSADLVGAKIRCARRDLDRAENELASQVAREEVVFEFRPVVEAMLADYKRLLGQQEHFPTNEQEDILDAAAELLRKFPEPKAPAALVVREELVGLVGRS